MDVRLLGPLEVRLEDGPVDLGPRKQRAVLAMLALEPGRTVSADRLAEGLWGDTLPPSAPKMVQLYVSRLRRVLDGGGVRIVTRDRGYELHHLRRAGRRRITPQTFGDAVGRHRPAGLEREDREHRPLLARPWIDGPVLEANLKRP